MVEAKLFASGQGIELIIKRRKFTNEGKKTSFYCLYPYPFL